MTRSGEALVIHTRVSATALPAPAVMVVERGRLTMLLCATTSPREANLAAAELETHLLAAHLRSSSGRASG